MPQTEIDEHKEKWITVGGRKVKVKPGEELSDALERPEDVSDTKAKNTKEAQTEKSYVKRHDLIKTQFKIRDKVVYDKLEKSGVISGFDGNYVSILGDDKRNIQRHKNDIFKLDELTPYGHWDTMSTKDRYETCKGHNVSSDYIQTNWHMLPENVKKVLLKAQGPAGYESTVSTNTAGVYNPVNQDTTVSQKIRDAHEETEDDDKEEVDKTDTTNDTTYGSSAKERKPPMSIEERKRVFTD